MDILSDKLVPAISGRSLRSFRVVLGIIFFVLVLGFPQGRIPVIPFGLKAWLLANAALFIVGLYPRAAYAGMVLGMAVLTSVEVQQRSIHSLGMPFVTMLGWLAVPWHARPDADRQSRAYGFALWWPGLTMGGAFLAAAYAKLQRNGLGWITSGAARYHFVTDARNTPFTWGVYIASHPTLAVFFSLMAIVIESSVIGVIAVKNPRIRTLFFLEAALMFAGFYVFQGVAWPFWWMCALAFLPWHGRDWTHPVPSQHTTTMAQNVIAIAFVAVQVFASATRTEIEPWMSNFPMYEQTYASPAEYDDEMMWRFVTIEMVEADGQVITELVLKMDDDTRNTLLYLASGRAYSQSVLDRLCRSFGELPDSITVAASRGGFDWQRGAFKPRMPMQLAPVPMARICRGR
jgi:hypothetical protein